VVWEKGTLAVVDDERGVFRVVEEAPRREPTLWLLDRNRHWRAVRSGLLAQDGKITQPVTAVASSQLSPTRTPRCTPQRPRRKARRFCATTMTAVTPPIQAGTAASLRPAR
jgi:hypothetical protein